MRNRDGGSLCICESLTEREREGRKKRVLVYGVFSLNFFSWDFLSLLVSPLVVSLPPNR